MTLIYMIFRDSVMNERTYRIGNRGNCSRFPVFSSRCVWVRIVSITSASRFMNVSGLQPVKSLFHICTHKKRNGAVNHHKWLNVSGWKPDLTISHFTDWAAGWKPAELYTRY